MQPGLGTILRLLGPLIEIVCIIGLFQVRGRGQSVLGLPLEYLFYAGIAAGFVVVLVGIALSRRPVRPKDRWDLPRDVE
jgi:hypothetical protein